MGYSMVKDFQNRRPLNHGAFSRYLRTPVITGSRYLDNVIAIREIPVPSNIPPMTSKK